MQSGKKIECSICEDHGYIYYPEINGAEECSCMAVKRQRTLQRKSGISEAFKQKRLDNFDVEINKTCKAMRKIAYAYMNDFSDNGQLYSIGFFGQSGTGKTHLSIAIANELLEQGIAVHYMPYVERITKLKNLNRQQSSRYNDNDDLCYDKAVNELKNVKVLLIDDLFKRSEDNYGKINTVDIRIMFEIINERYLRGLPIIVSCELELVEITKIDEALGSRITEMCGEYKYIIPKNQQLNYRLKEYMIN